MPSGKTHDFITLALALPSFGLGYVFTGSLIAACVLTGGFLFGGLMFGPDLDTPSRQYSRWLVARPIWLPYRALFRHRSRFTHGLILGPLLRVLYFHAIVAAAGFAIGYVWAWYSGGQLPSWSAIFSTWQSIGQTVYRVFGEAALIWALIGIWLGAASHTFTDLAGTYIRTGRVIRPL